MGVPGRAAPSGPPPGLADTELFAVDAYRRSFDSRVVEVDADQRRLALARTAFYPGGGGQPHDLVQLRIQDHLLAVTRVRQQGGQVWHWLNGALPAIG